MASHFTILLPRPGTGAEYCDQSLCVSVREHIAGTAGPIFTKFFVHILCGPHVATLIRYICLLSILCMTPRLSVMGSMAYFNTAVEFDVYECLAEF